MKHFALYSLFSLFLLSSCKKKEFPENSSSDPSFYVKAEINGTPVELKAGMLGYYMYSSHVQDSNGIYHFIAELKPQNCNSNCRSYLKFSVSDNKACQPGESSNASNSIKTGEYLYANTLTSIPYLQGIEVKFNSSFNKNALAYNWDFGDGFISTDANPTHTFTSEGNYETCLLIDDGIEASNICNTSRISAGNICRTAVKINSINGNTISFGNVSNGVGPYTYHWNFGDGDYSTQSSPVHAYDSAGLYTVKLKIKNSANDSAMHTYLVNTSQSYKAAPNFSVASMSPIYNYQSLFSRIKITYVDENGIEYNSTNSAQTNLSNFKIESVENYKPNERDHATKKLKITFSCDLYNGSSVVKLKNGEAVIAVSYK